MPAVDGHPNAEKRPWVALRPRTDVALTFFFALKIVYGSESPSMKSSLILSCELGMCDHISLQIGIKEMPMSCTLDQGSCIYAFSDGRAV